MKDDIPEKWEKISQEDYEEFFEYAEHIDPDDESYIDEGVNEDGVAI